MHRQHHHIAAVAAVTKEGGLGASGNLPWSPRRLGLDMAFLQFITTNDYRIDGHVVQLITSGTGQNEIVMGRKTWESLPPRMRPLKLRKNYVITSDQAYTADGATVCNGLEAFLQCRNPNGPAYLLGGSAIYKEGIETGIAECVFLTHLVDHPDFPCDVHFPMESLGGYKHSQNITKLAHDTLKEKLKLDDTHYLQEGADPLFIDGDVTYRIFVYYNN